MPLVKIDNLSKAFFTPGHGLFAPKQIVQALDGVSLVIEEGINFGLVGESGSGKSTLARLLVKLYEPQGGAITVDGQEWRNLSKVQLRRDRQKVQMVFQDPFHSLDPRFSVEAVLREAIMADSNANKMKDIYGKERIKKIISAVGLPFDVLGRYTHELSGGERQRIAIARSLLMNPRLLILDEAVSALDVLIQAQLIDLLSDLQKNQQVTYLFITHNLRIVRKLCPQLAVMHRGRIVEMGATEEIFNNPLNPYTADLLSAAIDYKSRDIESEYPLPKNTKLIDKGNGHFVLE